MFNYETVIRLHHTDAAGIVFYGRFFTLAQDCLEAFLQQHMPLASIIHSGDFSIPAVHARADYRRPLRLSDRLTIQMTLGKLGTNSFELEYQLKNAARQVCADVVVTHVTTNKHTGAACSIPETLRQVLEHLR
ncbi:MAG TPA: acyl-CoA thioesterase [Phycisphaerales bacterium]|nr:acyl-CoA thioesterase [Phycisphaerales bacterium]